MRSLRWCGSAWWRCTETGCRCGRPGGRGSHGRRRAGHGSTDDGRRRPAVAEHRFYSCEERVRVLDLECMATASSVVDAPGGGGGGTVTRAPLPRPSPRARCLVSPQGRKWKSVKCVLAKLSCYLHQWKVLCDDAQATLLQRCILLLDKRRGELLRIVWR